MKIELSSDERRHLKALAHPLNPVVMIGNNGLTDAVMREIAINLDAHELIKIRVQGDDREVRVALLEQICQAPEPGQMEAARAIDPFSSRIDNLWTIYRKGEEKP